MSETHPCILSASILAADFAALGADITHALQAGTDYIHFDVMDHHFVPNLSIGAVVCESLRKAHITAPIDVHLMVTHPEQYIEPFAKAGANMILFHPETTHNATALIERIESLGMQAGIVINPDKTLDLPAELITRLQLVLVMSVYPGFAGQTFLPDTLPKLTQIRAQLDAVNPAIWLGIDGGIKTHNLGEVAQHGANFFVIGSGLFQTHDYAETVTQCRRAYDRGKTC